MADADFILPRISRAAAADTPMVPVDAFWQAETTVE